MPRRGRVWVENGGTGGRGRGRHGGVNVRAGGLRGARDMEDRSRGAMEV